MLGGIYDSLELRINLDTCDKQLLFYALAILQLFIPAEVNQFAGVL